MNRKEKIVTLGLLAILLLSCCPGSLFSQELKLASELYPEHRYYPLRGEVFFKAYNQIKGCAYLNEDWVEGNIYLENGEVLVDVKYKADMYSHYLLVYNEYLKRVVKLERTTVRKFDLLENGVQRVFMRTDAGRNINIGPDEFFVEVLQEGYLSFYKLHYREVVPMRTPEMPFIDEFYSEVDYYLVYQGDWDEIRLRRAVLIRTFPEYKDEIKRYIRQNKLRLKDEHDFAKVVAHLSKIVKLIDDSK